MKDTLRKLLSTLLVFMMMFTNVMPVSAIAEASLRAQSETDASRGFTFSTSGVQTRASDAYTEEYTIEVGETARLSSQWNTTRRHEWSIEGDVNSVTYTGGGSNDSMTIRGEAPGEVIVTHAYEYRNNLKWYSETDTYRVTIVAPVTSISVEPTELAMYVGQEPVTLVPTVLPDSASDKTVTYTSGNSAVAAVDANGRVTAVGVGETDITVRSHLSAGVYTTVHVKVENVRAIEVAPKELSLNVGEQGALTATVTMVDDALEAEQPIWSTSDAAVATVDENGSVTAIGAGTATITATAGALSDTATVQVAATVTLDMTQVGGTTTVQTITAPTTVSELTAGKGDYSWKIGDNYVSADSRITGNVTLVAQELSVATDLILDPTELNLNVNETNEVTATVVPESAVDKTVIWTSDDPAIAAVDPEGNVMGISAGTTTVTARIGNVSKSIQVIVTAPRETWDVYVYVKIEVDSGISTDGWTLNDNNWYTIGKITVPASVVGDPNDYIENSEYKELVTDALLSYLPSIELHSINANVAKGIKLNDRDVVDWKYLKPVNGADNYNVGMCWHLDGFLTVKAENSTLTIKYVYSDGTKVAEDYVATVPNGTSVAAVPSPVSGREGYTPDQAVVGPVVVTGDRTIVVTYFPNNHTVTYRWTGLPNRTLYDEDGKVVNPQEPAERQYVIGAQYTVDTTYTRGMTLYVHDAYGNVNGKYTFSGWSEDGTQVMPARNVIIHGQWSYEGIPVSTYHVTYFVDGQQDGEVETYVPNQPVTVRDIPTKENHTFTGWTSENEEIPTSGVFQMPGEDVVFEGTFTRDMADYKIEHYYQVEGEYPDTPQWTDTRTGNVGDTVTAETSPAEGYEYYVFDNDASGNLISGEIDEDGTLVLKLYFRQHTYTVEHYVQNLDSDAAHIQYDLLSDLTDIIPIDGEITVEWVEANKRKTITTSDLHIVPDQQDTYQCVLDPTQTDPSDKAKVVVDGDVIKLYYNRQVTRTRFNDGRAISAYDNGGEDGAAEIRQGQITIVTHYVGGQYDGYICSNPLNFRWQQYNCVDVKADNDESQGDSI